MAASRIRFVLDSCGLTLHQVSRESERLYGAKSPFRIPHTLYHSVANSPSFTPSLPETCALSRITGYRFEDWLRTLGIDLRLLAALQAALPLKRTRVLDPALNGDDLGLGLREQAFDRDPTGVVPLGQFLHWAPCQRLSGEFGAESHTLFARIGREDAFAFPELLPGSIVRLDAGAIPLGAPWAAGSGRPDLLLVEHERGLWCGRFHFPGDGTLHAVASELAYSPIVLRLPQEARILGRVEMEIRWMHQLPSPSVPVQLAGYQHPQTLEPAASGVGVLIRRARTKAGLTLQEASRLSRRVAEFARDERHAIAQSTLSDYEVQSVPPRHLEKVLTLCLVYGIQLKDFIAASGAAPQDLGRQPIPPELMPERLKPSSRVPQGCHPECGDSSSSLFGRLGVIPWFLVGCFEEISGIPQPSLRDFFWLGGTHPFLPAHTEGSVAALVDRRRKRPTRMAGMPAWLQPAYVLLLRGGDYRCACCSLDGQTLLLSPEPKSGLAPETLRLGRDAEVVGQIIALARRIV
jgi:hypothetical protein